MNSQPPRGQRQPHIDNTAPVRCCYADDPARRPRCTLTAEIQLGRTALCGSCARSRSTLGKGTTPVRLPPSPPVDVLGWVNDAHTAVHESQRLLAAAVTRARTQGHTWTQIGNRLGITRQAAQQRFGHDPLLQA
ncbi:MAG: hypothetical protein ACRDOK_26410 [Streptosporangiaceae bacterium]